MIIFRHHRARWLPPAVLFLLAALIPLGEPAVAQGNASTTAAPKSQPQPASSIQREPMVFYLAKGELDACGSGCSEWIAAEGGFDIGAPQRLRALLARLGKRKLPIFFHSPGGLASQAMDIGRLLRGRQMTAGVSRTIPAGCIGASDESCRALKRSGQVLDAELSNVAGCNSACVIALIGAKVRQVPPGARLGVHAGKPVRLYPDGRVKAALPGDISHESNAQIRRYYKEMQIATGLFDLGAKVPHEQAHFLSRDEIATFSIDTREFLESRWVADAQPPSAMKLVVEAKGPGRKEFRTSIVKLACAGPRRIRIGYFRGSEQRDRSSLQSAIATSRSRRRAPYRRSIRSSRAAHSMSDSRMSPSSFSKRQRRVTASTSSNPIRPTRCEHRASRNSPPLDCRKRCRDCRRSAAISPGLSILRRPSGCPSRAAGCGADNGAAANGSRRKAGSIATWSSASALRRPLMSRKFGPLLASAVLTAPSAHKGQSEFVKLPAD
jgi:hypothetical protein